MKTLKTIIVILALSLGVLSCSKEDSASLAATPPAVVTPIIYGEENPHFAFISRMPNITPYTNAIGGAAQMGYIFKCTEKGKINALIVKIPATNNALKVYLWDKVTLALIKTEIVDVTTANVDITKVITPILLEKNKEYIITIFTDDYFFHQANSGAVSYPVIAGNIQILGTRSGYGDLCPQAGGSSNGYTGDISFNFQRIE